MKPKQGLLFVVSAPSGAGKTTLCRAVSSESMDNVTHSISYTTRKPRPGEIDGRDYHFVSPGRFQEMIKAGDFAEWAEVHTNLYGTSRRVLDDLLSKRLDVILDIDTQGAKQIKQKFESAVYIFIMPPSIEILEERLRNRKSDNEEEIRKRMMRAREEIRDFGMYDYIIVNREFDRALTELRSIMTSEHCRTRFADEHQIRRMTEESKTGNGA
ncbi:MAG TPA: guanylate kinase [Nitrospirota bacterium]|nr:guanylate kinase [Nitrospirota bacterium]